MNRRIGIYGGTFDPIHAGHILVAQEAKERYDLNKVLFVVSGDPYQKSDRDVTDPEDRFAMTAFAIEPYRHWASVSRVEVDRHGPTYTIDTLTELHRPDEDIFLIVGDDVDLSSWKDANIIHKYAQICVHDRWLNLSSTVIRERLKAGLPVVPLIDQSVYEFIQERGLYGCS